MHKLISGDITIVLFLTVVNYKVMCVPMSNTVY